VCVVLLTLFLKEGPGIFQDSGERFWNKSFKENTQLTNVEECFANVPIKGVG